MLKAFVFGLIAGAVLLIASGVLGFQSRQNVQEEQQKKRELALYKAEITDATPIKLGVLTERQRKHSKLYNSYQQESNKKISDLFNHPEGKVLGIVFGIGLGPKLPEDTPENYFSKLANATDAIVRGRVTKKVSQITEDDSFIFTDYDVVVMEVLKNNVISPLDIGTSIIVTRPGGKIVVDDVIVYAKDLYYLPLPISDKDVVLFLKFIPETGAYQTAQDTGSFALDGGILQPLTKAHFPPGVLQDSNSFLQTIRKISK